MARNSLIRKFRFRSIATFDGVCKIGRLVQNTNNLYNFSKELPDLAERFNKLKDYCTPTESIGLPPNMTTTKFHIRMCFDLCAREGSDRIDKFNNDLEFVKTAGFVALGVAAAACVFAVYGTHTIVTSIISSIIG